MKQLELQQQIEQLQYQMMMLQRPNDVQNPQSEPSLQDWQSSSREKFLTLLAAKTGSPLGGSLGSARRQSSPQTAILPQGPTTSSGVK